jgi:hypothetical protein
MAWPGARKKPGAVDPAARPGLVIGVHENPPVAAL